MAAFFEPGGNHRIYRITSNIRRPVITNASNSLSRANATCYGSMLIPYNSKGVHQWTFEILVNASGYMAIGIDESFAKSSNQCFYLSKNTYSKNYSYQSSGTKHISGISSPCGCVFNENDTIHMLLDMTKKTLSFRFQNESEMGHIKISPTIYGYIMAVYLPYSGDSICLLEYRCFDSQNDKENDSKKPENLQTSEPKPPSISAAALPVIPKQKKATNTCPICFTALSSNDAYIFLKRCKHLICYQCIKGYIEAHLKDIAKYPMTCFMNGCEQLLEFQDVSYALDNDKTALAVYDKFNVLCAISPNEREHCPKCGMLFFYQSKWQRDNVKPFKWVPDDARVICKKCRKKFKLLIVRRHHCTICGEIFCDECTSNELPLSAASIEMLQKWIKDEKEFVDHTPQKKMVKKTKKWFSDLSISSTSQNLEDSGDDLIKTSNCKQYESEHKQDAFAMDLSGSTQDLLEREKVRCCYDCWLDYYRAICAECDYVYCIECRLIWHGGYDCYEIKKKQLTVQLNEARTEQLMLNQGWRRCAGCKIWVEKSAGCNHMTHENCPNPNQREQRKTHFCYCCGELLYDPHRKHEKNGKLHFEKGVFEPCRNDTVAQRKRNKLKDEVQRQIDNVRQDLRVHGHGSN